MIWPLRRKERKLDGFVYRAPGPDGTRSRWIARSALGHVAHGRTPEAAALHLRAGMEALAAASGQSLEEWARRQHTDGSRFLSAGELVQA